MPEFNPTQNLRHLADLTQQEVTLALDISRETLVQTELGCVNSPDRTLIEYLNDNSGNFYPAPFYENFMIDYRDFQLAIRTETRALIRAHPPVGKTFKTWRASFAKSSRAFAKLFAVPVNDVIALEEGRYMSPALRNALNDAGVETRSFGGY